MGVVTRGGGAWGSSRFLLIVYARSMQETGVCVRVRGCMRKSRSLAKSPPHKTLGQRVRQKLTLPQHRTSLPMSSTPSASSFRLLANFNQALLAGKRMYSAACTLRSRLRASLQPLFCCFHFRRKSWSAAHRNQIRTVTPRLHRASPPHGPHLPSTSCRTAAFKERSLRPCPPSGPTPRVSRP